MRIGRALCSDIARIDKIEYSESHRQPHEAQELIKTLVAEMRTVARPVALQSYLPRKLSTHPVLVSVEPVKPENHEANQARQIITNTLAVNFLTVGSS